MENPQLSIHRYSPKLTALDSRRLPVRSVDYYRADPDDSLQTRINRTDHDAQGRLVAQWDPRLWRVAQANLTTVYSLSAQVLGTVSVDAGWRVDLLGEGAQPLEQWDGRGTRRQMRYDEQLRPVAVVENGESTEQLAYGDATLSERNQCGRLIRHDDLAGVVLFNGYGLSGAVLEQERRFASDSGSGFVSQSRLTALGDVQSQTDARGNEQRFSQTLDGQLRAVDLRLSNTAEWLPMVRAITYNAHGQVEQEVAGNGVVTVLEYTDEDGRLKRLLSRVGQEGPLQDLRYAYDPVGNVLSIEDAALPIRYFANQRIEPINRYTYDSLSQLIEATGWEAGTVKHGPLSEATPTLANYRQTYRYDDGNNLLELTHVGAQNPGHRLVAAAQSNRCLPVREGVEPGEEDFRNGFDANGNLLNLQPGQALSWDLRNQLQEVRPVERDTGPDDSERYVYGADGMRVRKLRTLQTNAQTNLIETRYLPGLEIRTHSGTGEELYVIEVNTGRSRVRVLHWETGRPAQIANNQQRYSLSDHLGSSTVELDQHANLITQERYYPFGGTAWSNGDAVQVSYKTVRYSGKERDATGLYYYGFRYYAPQWQRWLNPDPAGDVDGVNLFCFVTNSPLNFVDLHGGIKFPSDLISSEEVRGLVQKGNINEAQSVARARSISDTEVLNGWVFSLVSAVDMQSMTVFQNRLNNTIYRVDSSVENVSFIVKKMHSPIGPQIEELSYFFSEKLGLHLVPPTKAKAKSMIQQEVVGASSGTKQRSELPEVARLFYYLINEFDDNSGNQLWDASGNVYLIDHEAAFSSSKNTVYDLSTIDLSKAFDAELWDRFKSISGNEWKNLITNNYSALSKGQVAAFLGRIQSTKVAVQSSIDRGDLNFGVKRSFAQRVLGKKIA